MKHAIPQRYAIPHRYATRPGLYFTEDGGADVIVRSETADQVWLCIYEKVDQPTAFFNDAIRIFNDSATPFINEIHEHAVCTRIIEPMYVRETLFRMDGPNYGLWYVHLPKAWDGMRYAYRVDGAWDPSKGLRVHPYKLLLDPYGKGIDGRMKLSPAAFSYQCDVSEDGKVRGSAFGPMSTVDALGNMPVSVAIDDRDKTKHDADPSHPHVPWSKTVLYELHVKGFTANAPWLPKELRGTYAGLAHPTTLSYLQSLGVTSIELLPIQAKQDELFLQERGRHNYWGYSPLSYFSPEPSYATAEAQRKGARAIRDEVIGMVRALHEAGFEVIMDVVYNHTCEGGVEGPTTCWRGLDALLYYRRQKGNIGRLEDTTGCGNTFDFTNTHVVTFAVDSLRYWAKRIGIDGFRFDLGVSLARLDGDFTKHHPFLYALRSDLLLGNLKLIMEPWDLGPQGWRTGGFGMPFSEWNDRFRDTVRRFWITDTQPGAPSGIGMQEMATRLCGSSDLFATEPGRGCVSSINYVSCHDGFTLTDLTRYAVKHNEANGENNIDGSNVNHSANFGVEGPSDDPAIIRKREQAAMNMLGTLMLSLGTPMMLAGDEFGNSQSGNNNAYAQDYGKYQDYLSQLGTLHDYYSAQEQQQAARRQQVFSNVMTVLGVLGDAVQIVLSGTTGVGSMLSGLLNTGYNIYSGNRQYEANRADTQWNQKLQERQYQDSLNQQRYENETSEREYQDKLNQQKFNNDVTSQKLNIALGEWNLKKSNAAQKASRAGSTAAGSKTGGTGTGSTSSGTANRSTGTATRLGSDTSRNVTVPYMAMLMRSQGKSDTSISTALRQDGYSSAEIAQILQQMRR